MKRAKKILSLFLAAVMLAGLLPTAAFATGGDPAPTGGVKTVMAGTSGIKDPTAEGSAEGTHYTPNSYIYFGQNNGTPIKWRVLDADKANTGGAGMFLLSEHLLASGVYFQTPDTYHEDSTLSGHGVYRKGANHQGGVTEAPANAWQESTAQAWAKDFAEGSGSGFNSGERAALLATTKEDGPSTNYSKEWGTSELKGDKVFFLSAEELAQYVGNYHEAPGLGATPADSSSAGGWWLRSAYDGGRFDMAGAVAGDGVVGYGNIVEVTNAARPAFNLDLSKVLFTSPADGTEETTLHTVKAYSGNEWKVTLRSDATGYLDAAPIGGGHTRTVEAGNNITFFVSHGDESTRGKEITAMLLDESNNVRAYGKGKLDMGSGQGRAYFTIPADLAPGVYDMQVMLETWNGANKTNEAIVLSKEPTKLTVLPASTPTPYDLWVDGTQVTSANAGNVLNKTNGDGEPTVSFDATSNTLTLSGATITKIYEEYPCGIASKLPNLTLNLIGDNTITVDDTAGGGLYTEGNLTVTGSGSLTATGYGGVAVTGNLTVESGTLTGKATYSRDFVHGIGVGGVLTVESGSVTGESGVHGCGIYVEGGATINGGSVTGRSGAGDTGILAFDHFEVTNSNAKITAQGGVAALAVSYIADDIEQGRLKLPTGYLPETYKIVNFSDEYGKYAWIAHFDATESPSYGGDGSVKELSLPAHMHGETPFIPLTQTKGDLPAGTYFLDRDIDLTGVLNISGTVTLCLNGHKLTTTGSNYINVNEKINLTICDCKTQGSISSASNSGNCVKVEGNLTIESGTISGKSTSGLVEITKGGRFTMTGGTIIKTDRRPLVNAERSDPNNIKISGGYFVNNGGAFFNNCKATGGYFSHEPATTDIATDYKAFEARIKYEGREYLYMIAHKDAHCHHGIVFAEQGSGSSYYLTGTDRISLSDGATHTICLGGKTVGGFDLTGDTTLNLYGCFLNGSIGGSVTNSSGSGISVGEGATLNLYGGSITGNGGVGVSVNGDFTIYGGTFSSNGNGDISLPSGKVFTIGESFNPASDTRISVKTADTPTESAPVAITGENTRDYSRFFVSANDSYRVINGANNVLYLVPRTALTITANSASKNYDGAALTDSGFKVTYNGTEYSSSNITGTQTASFTIGETTYTVTATVSGSATNVPDTSTGNNTIIAWSISDSNGVVQSSTSIGGNLPFAVSTAAGTLTINKAQKALTITVKNQEYDYDGTAKGAPNDTITDDFDKYVEVEGLATGDTLTSLTILGQRTDAGTYMGVLVASNAAISSTNYNYSVQYVAGSLIINADETAPTGTITVSSEAWERSESWDSLQSEISFDKFSNKNYTVSIAANDSGSGVASFGYLISNAEISDEELSKRTDWISYTDPFELTEEGKYIIYAKITDHGNNVTYISTRGLVLDTTDPVFEGIENNRIYCSQAQFTVKDASPVVVYANSSVITPNSQGVYTIITTTGGDYTVRAVDNAGNETKAQIKINMDHAYGTPNYTWEGFESCLAEITCVNCTWSDQEYGTVTNAVTTQPTCTAEGVRTYTAAFTKTWAESQTETQPIAMLGHSTSLHEAQAATCTDIGWNEYVTCSRCDYTTYEEIAALGHSYDTEWKSDKDNHWHECSACGDKADEAKHEPKTVNAKEATTSQKGYTGDTVCEICGFEIAKGKEIPVISDPNNPPTGDNSKLPLWIALMVTAVAGLGGTVWYGKKKKAR